MGGEKLEIEQLSKISSLVTEVYDEYGPTETTVGTTLILKNPEIAVVNNIGRPYKNVKCYILDSNINPVPIGAIGELYIGGSGLSRGYLNQPELTKERFILNPFATEQDKLQGYTQLYKTGDLARYLSDGNIEYIGRNDFQVKIRGFRIELGEIEKVLSQFAGITQCVAICYQDPSPYLAAFYVSANPIDPDTIREHLITHLPDYMVPSAIVPINRIPLTVNGKLDSDLLPKPELIREEYVAPSTEIEQQIASIWQEALDVKRVGIMDNFFRLGGDSILSIRVVAQIQLLGISISVRDLLTYKTIRELVAHMNSSENIPNGSLYCNYKLINDETKQTVLEALSEQASLIEDIYPASYLQIGMLLESMKDANGGTYHPVSYSVIDRPFNKNKLQDVLVKLIEKHPLLRTSFIQNAQHGYLSIQYSKIDIHQHFSVIKKVGLNEFIEKEIHNDILINKPGLFHFFILNPTSTQFTFVFSHHHVITDGWGEASFFAEFAAAYIGHTSIVDEIIPLYPRYIEKERDAINSPAYRNFWDDYLADYDQSITGLKLNRKISEERHWIKTKNCVLDDADGIKILALSRELGLSPDLIFLSIYALTLSRLTSTHDLIIGLVINNRLEELGGDKVFGLHLNTVPLRLTIKESYYRDLRSFILYVAQEKERVQQYKMYPYQKIKSDLKSEKDLYIGAFNYVHFHIMETFVGPGGILDGQGFVKTSVPLSIDVSRYRDNFDLQIKGASQFIDLDFGQKILDYMNYYLNNLIEQKDKTNPILLVKEYQQVIYDWNQTARDYPKNKTLHALFSEQAKKNPDQVAIVFESQTLTYQELDKRSNQLARYIIEHNPSEIITLFFERSPDMIIAMLGVMKAGSAYVPIDPKCPKERIKYILMDTHSTLLLTQHALKTQLQDTIFEPVKLLSIDGDEYCKHSEKLLHVIVAPTDLAYVIYTSGTTGVSKGVMIEHQGIVNYVLNIIHHMGLVKFDQHLLLHDYTFDLVLTSMYGGLLSGAAVHILPKRQQENVNYIIEYVLDTNITFIKTTPMYMEAVFINDGRFQEYCVQQPIKIVLGGEKLDNRIACQLQKNFFKSHLNLIYHYGPTEATVGSHFLALNSETIWEWFAKNPVIGRSFDNVKSYILDQNCNPVPIGTIGELYIGGAGLARGYLNQPELTHQHFIPNLFSTEEDLVAGYTRLYKTGDLVCYLPNGNIEYIGRNDFQVKIRGFRIELGEIEAVVGQYVGIKQCKVVYTQEPRPHLAVFYVSSQPLDEMLMRDYLASYLPDYMLPSAFVVINSIPLTNNGKFDRSALPNYEFKSKQYIAPQDETESMLCQLWQEVLGISHVGMMDDFFHLGGHSILAIHLAHRMGQILNREILVKDIFQHRTLMPIQI